jgi:serpin B
MKTNYEEIEDTANGLGFFSCNMYKTLAQGHENLFFSPYSISSALSLAYLGAKNDTKDQMAKVLGYRLAASKVISSLVEIGKNLNSKRNKVKTNVANAAWIQEDYVVLEEYLDVLKNIGDLVKRVDFVNSGEAVRQEVNLWVEEKTEQLIKNLIPEGVFTALTRLVLVNAVYFKGTWAAEFDPKHTTEKPFHNIDGSQSVVETMSKSNIKGSYAEGPGFRAVRLPYGNEYSPVQMTVILPEDLKRFEAGFDFNQLEGLQWETAKITLTMPKFKLERECELSAALSKMGIKDAFVGGKADFSGITGDTDLNISAILHKAVVEVNEEGTEAAAATAVVMKRSCCMAPPKYVTINVDHPFMFMIGDSSPLFMGRVTSL